MCEVFPRSDSPELLYRSFDKGPLPDKNALLMLMKSLTIGCSSLEAYKGSKYQDQGNLIAERSSLGSIEDGLTQIRHWYRMHLYLFVPS